MSTLPTAILRFETFNLQSPVDDEGRKVELIEACLRW